MARSDESMLRVLMASGRLSDVEERAFSDMLEKLKNGRRGELYPDQRSWAEGRYKALELDAEEPSLNLVSSGVVPETMSRVKHDFEMMPRPKAPPGRR